MHAVTKSHPTTELSLADLAARVAAALHSLAAALRPPYARPWTTLDARLLRDIGVTPQEAETARIALNWGATEPADVSAFVERSVAGPRVQRR